MACKLEDDKLFVLVKEDCELRAFDKPDDDDKLLCLLRRIVGHDTKGNDVFVLSARKGNKLPVISARRMTSSLYLVQSHLQAIVAC